jgi:hypothetical protein
MTDEIFNFTYGTVSTPKEEVNINKFVRSELEDSHDAEPTLHPRRSARRNSSHHATPSSMCEIVPYINKQDSKTTDRTRVNACHKNGN